MNRKITRKIKVLAILIKGAQSSAGIARILDVPEASVRRDIQALRRDGHNISFAGNDSLYRLGQ